MRQGAADNAFLKAPIILSILDDQKLPRNVCSFEHSSNPAATGLWTKEGKQDPVVFKQLEQLATLNAEGQLVVTRETFDRLLLQRHGAGYWRHDYGRVCPLAGSMLRWQTITQRSLDGLVKFNSDTTDAAGVPALTLDRVRQFYTDSTVIMEQRAVNKTSSASLCLIS